MRCGIGAYEKVWGLLGGAQRAGALGMQGPAFSCLLLWEQVFRAPGLNAVSPTSRWPGAGWQEGLPEGTP